MPRFLTAIVCPRCHGHGKVWIHPPGGSQPFSRIGHIMARQVECRLCHGRRGLLAYCKATDLKLQFALARKTFCENHRGEIALGEAFVPADILDKAKSSSRNKAKALFGPPCQKCGGVGIVGCKTCRESCYIMCTNKKCRGGWVRSRQGYLTECLTCHGTHFLSCPQCHGMRAELCASCRGAGLKMKR